MELLNVELEQESILETLSELAVNVGISDEIKQALLQCFEHVAWVDDDGQTYYDALYDALYPPVDLSSISCVYTQSGTVYDTDSLDSLKSDLVVTAHYSDQSTETVTTYTLSGTLTEGTSTITVLYGGKTTTFDVTVTHNTMQILHEWDFTNSLVDSVGGVTATLSKNGSQPDLVRDSNGLNFSAYGQCVDLGEVYDRDISIDIEMSEVAMATYNGHIRLLMYGNAVNTGTGLLIFRYSGTVGWSSYVNSSWGNIFGSLTSRNSLDTTGNLKLTIKIDDNGAFSLYKDDVLIGTSNLTAPEKSTTFSHFYIGNSANNTGGANFYSAKVKKVKIYKEI